MSTTFNTAPDLECPHCGYAWREDECSVKIGVNPDDETEFQSLVAVLEKLFP